MEQFGSYSLIIAASVIIILSFFFGAIAKRTSVPSVLMLIALGVGLQYLLKYLGVTGVDFFPVLEVLGIIGLIMIVLEAALDLKLKREKLGTIIRSLLVAALGLGGSVGTAAATIFYLIPCFTWEQAFLYATPLSILSSAIIIPSVGNLPEKKKEFHIYESTFSDILGIMLFYFLIGLFDSGVVTEGGHQPGNPYSAFFISLIITLAISVVTSYLLLFIFQRIEEKAKLFVLISVLLLLYAVAKKFHLSPLIIILIFGLAVSNSHLFFRGPFKRMLHPEKFKEMEHGLHGLTVETAFVVRTFFFVIFGASILLASLFSMEVFKVSVVLLGSIYIIRWVSLKIFVGKDVTPQVWIAPRGLITVLLFYAIPVAYQTDLFDPGILLFIIITTGMVMTGGLISHSMDTEKKNEREKGDEFLLPVPGTEYTPTIIDPKHGRFGRWINKIQFFLKTKVWYKISGHPVYQSLKQGIKKFALVTIRTLGVKPSFNPENKSMWQRVHTVYNILKSPQKINLRENQDYKKLKSYMHRIIFGTDTLEGILFDIAVFISIMLSVAIVMLQSVTSINTVWSKILFGLEWIITILFIIEYALRIWTTAKPKKYIFSFFGMVDLLAIVPVFVELVLQDVYSLGVIRILRMLRIFRVLKLVRFEGEANVLMKGLRANGHKILVFLFFVIIVCTVMGAVMFMIEGPSSGFTSIPRGVYWAVVTLTTVGYGDIHPATPLGQFIAMLLMIMGYGVIAVPAGLMAAGIISSGKINAEVSNLKIRSAKTCPECNDEDQTMAAKFCSECGAKFDREIL